LRALSNHIGGHLLIAGLSLLLPLLLYRARHLDDNSLTSWQWVFEAADPGRLLLLLALLTPLFWLLAVAPDLVRRGAPGSGKSPAGGEAPTGGIPVAGQPPPGPGGNSLWARAWRRFGIPLLAFTACLLFLDSPETIVDSARYFIQAKSFSEYGPLYFFRQWGGEIFAWTDLPLLPALYGLLFTLWGESRLAAQLLNALFFALTALLIAQLGRDLWDEETGRTGAFLFLGFPYLYSQTPLLLVDVGTMFLVLLALAGFHRAMTRGGLYIVVTALAVIAVFLVKYSAWLLLSGLVPIFFCSLGADRRRALVRAGLALAPALVGVALLFWGMREVMADQLALLLEFQRPALRDGWSESLVSTFFFQTHPLLTAALLYSLYRAGRERDLRYPAVAWLIVLLLVIMELRRIRYSIPIFPLLALLAGYGLRDLADPGLRRHLLLVIVGSSLLLAWGAYLPFLKSMAERNLQQAGRYLDTLAEERIAVVVLAEDEAAMDPRVMVPILDLFTHKTLAYHPPAVAAGPPARIATSPLRFTWEMALPAFYFPATAPDPEILVIITSGPAAEFPPEIIAKLGDYSLLLGFVADSGIFQHRPYVQVFGRGSGAGAGLTALRPDFSLYNMADYHIR